MQENMFRQQYTAQNTSKLEQRATATTSQHVDAGEHVSPAVAVHCTEHQQIRTEGHSKQQANRLMQENMFRQQYTAQNSSKLEQRATATTSQQVDAGEHVSPAVHCTEHQQIRTEVHSKQQANRLMQENMFRQQYTAQNTSILEQRATARNKPTG